MRSSNGAYDDKTPCNGFIVYQSRNLATGQLPIERIICEFDLQDYYYGKERKSVNIDSVLKAPFINQGVA